jgi:hypothetical protein|tara:strand:- start:2654 stop:2812 length:159 start_codon:yes stop_codon:yes gene_type:complete
MESIAMRGPNPVEAILYPSDLTSLLAFVLFSVTGLIDLVVYRRSRQNSSTSG